MRADAEKPASLIAKSGPTRDNPPMADLDNTQSPYNDVKPTTGWRRRMHTVIFEADTPGGKAFDVVLIASILLSIAVVMLNSVEPISKKMGPLLIGLEWLFTILFTAEYICRLLCVGRATRYARSFYGVVDLLSVLPTFLSLLIPGSHSLLTIRSLRVLRIFRVLKITTYLSEARVLYRALAASRRKIVVFLMVVLTIVVILGSLMYAIEGRDNGFSSIPRGVYWAIVTLTTVGYGDISPQTALGQTIAAAVMILGYSILAIPTGIISFEFAQAAKNAPSTSTQSCPQCATEGHDENAKYCKFCGAKL